MKALVFHGPRQMRWEDWPEPVPADGEALVAVRAVGICGSDIHGYTGQSGRRTPPMIMGHEFAGEVIAVHSSRRRDMIGRRVVVRPFVHCGGCDTCRAGQINRCRNRRFMGGNIDGAMAERIAVPYDNLLPLRDGLPFAHGAVTEPLAVAVHAVRRAGDLSGRSVLVVGGGPIGLLTLVAARQLGAAIVVVTDPLPERRRIALAFGADAAVDPGDGILEPHLSDATGGRPEVDVAFDSVGIAESFAQALAAVRPGGVTIAIGGWKTVPVNLSDVVAREITIHGSFNFTPDDFALAKSWIEDGRVAAARLVTSAYRLPDGAAVFEDLAERRLDAVKVMLVSEDRGT